MVILEMYIALKLALDDYGVFKMPLISTVQPPPR